MHCSLLGPPRGSGGPVWLSPDSTSLQAQGSAGIEWTDFGGGGVDGFEMCQAPLSRSDNLFLLPCFGPHPTSEGITGYPLGEHTSLPLAFGAHPGSLHGLPSVCSSGNKVSQSGFHGLSAQMLLPVFLVWQMRKIMESVILIEITKGEDLP